MPPATPNTPPRELMSRPSTGRTMISCGVTNLRRSLSCDRTPSDPSRYPFYCPICMTYLKRVLVTQCCTNHICEFCAKEMIDASSCCAPLNVVIQSYRPKQLQQQGAEGGEDADGPIIHIGDCFADEKGIFAPFAVVPCPFCSRNLKLKSAEGCNPVRQYKDSPLPMPRLTTPTPDAEKPSFSCSHSPVAHEPHKSNSDGDSPVARPAPIPLITVPPLPPSASGAECGGAAYRRNALLGGRPDSATNTGAPSCLDPRARSLPCEQQCRTTNSRPVAAPSPVRTGDEYDALRRKLRPLDSLPSNLPLTVKLRSCSEPPLSSPGRARAGRPPLHPQNPTENVEERLTGHAAVVASRFHHSSGHRRQAPVNSEQLARRVSGSTAPGATPGTNIYTVPSSTPPKSRCSVM